MALNNSSLTFNGSTQYAKLSTAASIRNLSSFGFLMWVKVGSGSISLNQHAYVERQGTGTGIRFRCTPVKGYLQFGFSPQDGVPDTAYSYKTSWDNHWHLVGFSARLGGERPTYEITFDAVSVATGTLILPPPTVDANGNTVSPVITDTAPLGIYLGNHSRAKTGESFPSTTAWNGSVDDIMIFDNGMGQGEVNTYFSSNDFWNPLNQPAEDFDENRIFNWRFDENTGTTTKEDRDNTRLATLYQSGVASSALWTIDRPYLGEGKVDITIPSTPALDAPTAINADGATFTWTASTDNVWVQFYELQVSEFANFQSYTAYDMGRVLTKEVTGLLPATNYYARVRAFDAKLNASTYSVVRSFTTTVVGDTTPPSPPTNLAASYVTHSSFRLTFTASASNDTVGYKIDVSEYPDFRTFTGIYRNQDIGNSTTLDIFGTSALTSYYVRLRAYDAYDNESADSTVLRVNTPRQPDMTPPLPVNLLDATAVTSRAAIMNWREGVDDVGVAGYYVDVSTDATFSDRITANNVYWDTVDVGNVISFRIQGLEPEMNYFYRVRAYDEAGNISPNTEDGIGFVTSPPSMHEGGYLESVIIPNGYATVDSRYPTSPTSTEIGENIEELTVSNFHTSYISFTMDSVVGILERGSISLYATTTGTVFLRTAQTTIPEAVTYNTRPAMTSAEVQFTIPVANEWVELDITTLLATMDDYVIELRSADVTEIKIAVGNPDAREFRPFLLLQNDPLASTQPLETEISLHKHTRINLAFNPSFEENLNGWEGVGAIISRVAGGTNGSYALQCVGSLANQGVQNAGEGFMSPVTGGETITFSTDLRSLTGGTSYRLRVQGMTETGFVNAALNVTKDITIKNAWDRYFITTTVPAEVTHARLVVTSLSTVPFSFEMDHVLYEESDVVGIPFNGNTPSAIWVGTANNSTSRLFAPLLHVQTPFLGDSNANNSARIFFRRADDESAEWIPAQRTPTVDRELNMYSADVGPTSRNYNLIVNPSFEEENADEWQSTEDSAIVGTDAYIGNNSFSATYYLSSMKPIFVQAGSNYTLQARIKADPEVTVYSRVHFYNAAGTEVSTLLSTDYAYGDGGSWHLQVQTFTIPVDIETITVTFITEAVESHFYVDCVQVNAGDRPLPYRDGDTSDGFWEGAAHHSTTGIRLQHEQTYLIMTEFTDPEGFFDTTDDTVYEHVAMYEVPTPPDDTLTVTTMEVTANDTSIDINIPYVGDDNDNSTVRFEFKRTDLTTWSEFRPTYNRQTKTVTGTVPNLRAGTNYTVRAYLTDPDGVYGASGNMLIESVTTNYASALAAAEPHISFGGFVLMGRSDKKVAVTQHNAFGFPDRRVEIADLPRLEGAVERQALWGRKTISIRGFLGGDSREDLDEVKDALKRALAPKQQRLVIDTLSSRGRFYYATCTELNIDEAGESNISHLEWAATFVCADPFAYSIAETTIPTFTAANAGSISVVNGGDSTVDPYITISTPSRYPVALTLINNSTGERMAPKTTIVNGDRLILDSERRSLTKNGVELDYAGSFVRLAPGGNEISFQLSIARTATTASTIATTIPAPTVKVDARWRHKYL